MEILNFSDSQVFLFDFTLHLFKFSYGRWFLGDYTGPNDHADEQMYLFCARTQSGTKMDGFRKEKELRTPRQVGGTYFIGEHHGLNLLIPALKEHPFSTLVTARPSAFSRSHDQQVGQL